MDIEIFSDETIFKDEYLGLGCLFIPISFKENLIENLMDLRCLGNGKWNWDEKYCNFNCGYHKFNNCEIHFKDIDKSFSDKKLEIYKNWIDFIVNWNKNNDSEEQLIYFNILYLDLNKLNYKNFGIKTGDLTNIYNRFYRTNLDYAFKTFFNDNVNVKGVWHDNSSEKENHNYFSWHPISCLNEPSRNINFENDEINFISSNHNDYKDENLKGNANLIQLIDLILGCSNQILFKKSDVENKKILANEFYPLFKRLWENPSNPNSRYNYVGKENIAIFPDSEEYVQKDLFGNDVIGGKFHRNILISKPLDENNYNDFSNFYHS